MNRVVITGMGAISPLGITVAALRQGIKEGRSGLKYDETLKFVVGAVGDAEEVEKRWTAGERREMSRSSMYALATAEEALTQANALQINQDDTIVNIGTCMSDLMHIGETAQKVAKAEHRRISPYFVPRILNNLPAGYVAMKFKTRGGVEATSTACATGLHCIGNSFRAIRDGYAKKAIAGAVECALNPIAIAGFDRMRALAKGTDPTISRPFDKTRSGFVLSEGAGLVFMETLDDARRRGAPILAEVLGYGTSSDCYHISTPDPSAIGAISAMRRAIADVKCRALSSKDVGYVNAHATSTPNGDSIEAKACREIFAADTRREKIAVSSLKGHIGHLLGAAGSVELIATVCSMNDDVIPTTLNLGESDEDVGLDLIRRRGRKWDKMERISICNSFGFGATNASLICSTFAE